MLNYDEILTPGPYSLNRRDKGEILVRFMRQISELHYDQCPEYRRILDALDVKTAWQSSWSGST